MQTLLLALTVFGLVGSRHWLRLRECEYAPMRQLRRELDNEKRINQQMLAVQKEQMELEKKSPGDPGANRCDQAIARITTGSERNSARDQSPLRRRP